MINVVVLCKINKWQRKCYTLMSLAVKFMIFILLIYFLRLIIRLNILNFEKNVMLSFFVENIISQIFYG